MKYIYIHMMSPHTEKKIFIGIGVIGAFLIGFLFLFFANGETENKADLFGNSNNSTGEQPIRIEKGYLLGDQKVYRNSEKKIVLGISSSNDIDSLQGIEVEMIQGEINGTNYFQTMGNKRFILQDERFSNKIIESLNQYQGKNWASLNLSVKIPDFSKTQMPSGNYTLSVTLHRNEVYKSQIFFPVLLLHSANACDVNNDGFQNTVDLILTLKISNGEIKPKQGEKEKIDSNNNGVIDLSDTIKIFQCILYPTQNESEYFENQCNKSDDPIIKLLCPQIKPQNTNTSNIVNTGSSSSENDNCSDPIYKLMSPNCT